MTKKMNLVTPVGTARYVHLNEEDPKFGGFKTELILTAEEATTLLESAREFFGKAMDSVPVRNMFVREDTDKDGNPIWVFRCKTSYAPKIVDAAKRPTSVRVGAGTRMRISGSLEIIDVNGTEYLKAYLNAVQIVELSEGGAAAFEEIEGGFVDTDEAVAPNADFA